MQRAFKTCFTYYVHVHYTCISGEKLEVNAVITDVKHLRDIAVRLRVTAVSWALYCCQVTY